MKTSTPLSSRKSDKNDEPCIENFFHDGFLDNRNNSNHVTLSKEATVDFEISETETRHCGVHVTNLLEKTLNDNIIDNATQVIYDSRADYAGLVGIDI